MDAQDEEVGLRVEAFRRGLGLSQAEMSERLRVSGLNWSQGTLSKVETGARPVRIAELRVLSDMLDVDPLALVPGEPDLSNVLLRVTTLYREARDQFIEAEGQFRALRAQKEALGLLVQMANGEHEDRVVVADGPIDILRKACSKPQAPSWLDGETVLLALGVTLQDIEVLRTEARDNPAPRVRSLARDGSPVSLTGLDSLFSAVLNDDDEQVKRAFYVALDKMLRERFPHLTYQRPERDPWIEQEDFRVPGIDDEDED